MKKIKKSLALVLSLVMALGLLGVTAAADDADATVSLVSADLTATEGTDYPVTLHVDGSIGGVQGTILYDSGLFDFENVSMTRSVADVNMIDASADRVTTTDVIRVDKNASAVHFVLLSDGTADLVTFNFKAKGEIADVAKTTQFKLVNVKVSDAGGTAPVDNETVDKEVVASAAALTMEGSSVRTDGTFDLRFEVTLNSDFMNRIQAKGSLEISEVGMVLIPTQLIVPGAEIANDSTGAFCIGNNKPMISTKKFDELPEPETDGSYKFYGNIVSSAKKHINRFYSLRAFVVLSDGSTVYCDNADEGKKISSGTASRSCQSTAVSIYEDYKSKYSYPEDVAKLIAKAASEDWSVEEYKQVAAANAAALKQQLG